MAKKEVYNHKEKDKGNIDYLHSLLTDEMRDEVKLSLGIRSESLCEYVYYVYSQKSPFHSLSLAERKIKASTLFNIRMTDDFIESPLLRGVILALFNSMESELHSFYIANKEMYFEAIGVMREPIVGEVSADKYKALLQAKKEAQEICALALAKDNELMKAIEENFFEIKDILKEEKKDTVSKNILQNVLKISKKTREEKELND